MTYRKFTDGICTDWPHNSFTLIWLTIVVTTCSNGLQAQITDERARQRVQRLLQQDRSLEASIQGQRIDRQAEVARLEARIVKLEKLTRGLRHPISNAGFITLVSALEAEQAVEAEQAADAAPTTTAEPPADSDEAPPQLDANRSRMRPALLALIAADYSAELDYETLEARISLFEESQQLLSLERLTAKGLATRSQLEFQKLKRQAAESRVSRLDQQRQGLRELYPALFPKAQSTNSSQPSELPEAN